MTSCACYVKALPKSVACGVRSTQWLFLARQYHALWQGLEGKVVHT